MMISRIVLALALSAFLSVAISGEVLADDAEEPWYYDGCQEALIVCSASSTAYLYVNGLQVGTCISTPVTVATRPYLTNTLTLIADDVFTYELTATCTTTSTAPTVITGTAVLPTPEVDVITDTMGMQNVLDGSGGFLGIDMGGSLSDPNAPINRWLGIAEDFVDIINAGNILYIIGAVAGAGAILSWAIGKVKNPGM
jgi:hypothetical protein